MKLNKLITIILLASTLLTVTSCNTGSANNSPESNNSTVESVDKGNDELKKAYGLLVSASDKLKSMAKVIQNAWYYGIYGNNHKHTYSGLAQQTGLSSSDIVEVCKNYGIFESNLDEFSYDILIVKEVMNKKGYYEDVSSLINEAKTSIQNVTKDLDNYKDMKNFYSTCNAYLEWVSNPSGNFNQAQDTINNYEKEIKDYKNDMEFDYGN